MMIKIEKSIKEYLLNNIRTIPDFPKSGIQFKDITTLLKNRHALELTAYLLSKPYQAKKVDFVVGLESRGFLFGTVLALNLKAGFIPIRKPNKLPADSVSASYELEYGVDNIEMHKDAFEKGARILIHDDLIATGGTAAAATELVESLGGRVAGYSFIMELKSLQGKNKLPGNITFETILSI